MPAAEHQVSFYYIREAFFSGEAEATADQAFSRVARVHYAAPCRASMSIINREKEKITMKVEERTLT